jgi:hypothetical protein
MNTLQQRFADIAASIEARQAALTPEAATLDMYLAAKVDLKSAESRVRELRDEIIALVEGGANIVLDECYPHVAVTAKDAVDEAMAMAILGDDCPLTAVVDTKKVLGMVKAGKISGEDAQKIIKRTEVKTLSIRKVKA